MQMDESRYIYLVMLIKAYFETELMENFKHFHIIRI